MADGARDSENQSLPLWRRYRRPALTALAIVVVVVALRVAFPDTDFSRGSSARWWLIGVLVVVVLFGLGIQAVRRRRQETSSDGDRS